MTRRRVKVVASICVALGRDAGALVGSPRRRSRPRLDRQCGFALPIVIWGLGLIALLIVSFMTTARWRLQAAFNIYGAEQARLVASSAINIGVLKLLTEQTPAVGQPQRPVHDGNPSFCGMGGAAVALAIEDEGGKVDLNFAAPELLRTMFTGFGVDRQSADALATAIQEFRSPPSDGRAAVRSNAPAGIAARTPARFETALELDQVTGMEPALFRTMLPFVTTYSRRPGIYAQAAPPALFAALAGYPPEQVAGISRAPFAIKLDRDDPRFPVQFKQGNQSGVYLVHAEAMLPSGQTSARDVIVDFQSGRDASFALREIRRGSSRSIEELKVLVKDGTAALPPCV